MQSIHRPCTAVCFLEFVKTVYKQNINLERAKTQWGGAGEDSCFCSRKEIIKITHRKKNMSEDTCRLQLLVSVNKPIFHSKYKNFLQCLCFSLNFLF